jgi:hypothetical protein
MLGTRQKSPAVTREAKSHVAYFQSGHFNQFVMASTSAREPDGYRTNTPE